MLLVIHNLPKTMGFYDVKNLIQDKCGLSEVILDNFNLEGDYKRITVGLADEGDAALLVRKINGLYMEGSQLYVEDVRQKKLTEQPYRPIENPHVPQLKPGRKVQYNRQDAGMTSQPVVDAQPTISMPSVQMAYSNLPFYMSPIQTSYTNYENQAAQGAIEPQTQVAYFQTQIQQPVVENHWASLPAYASYPAKPQRLPNDDPISNSRDWQLGEWRHYRSPPPPASPPPLPSPPASPPPLPPPPPPPAWFLVLDNEPQWQDRKKTESSRIEQDRRSPGRHRERSGQRSRREESDVRSERDSRERSPARRRDEGNRLSRQEEDAIRSKHPSHIERSPPRDRDFDTRKREDRRQFDKLEHVYDRNNKRCAVDYRDRERKHSTDRERTRSPEQERKRSPDQERKHSPDRERKRSPNRERKRSSDRERKRSPDRHEKPRNYDKLYEPRDSKPIVEQESDRDYGKKRPYTDVFKSSRTHGNDPDNCTFSVSNPSIFKEQPIAREGESFRSKEGDTERGILDHNDPAKRSRFEVNEVATGPPKVDPPKPTSVLEPDMRKMIIRHNNWRYQVAGILAKQIMSAARGPGAFSKYSHVFKKLKQCVVARIDVRLGDTIVRTLMEMMESYRSRFPPEDDVTFFNAVLEKIELDEQGSGGDQAKENTSEVENYEKVTSGASAENAAKDANLMPPPCAPAQIRIPRGNPRPSVPPFQNREPNVTPTIQNSALTVTPQFQNTASTVTPQYQNTAPIITPQFQNTAPIVTLQYQNTAPIITPQFQNTAPTVTPQYQNTAPIITPQFQNTAPTVTPQYQNTAPIITPQFQNTAPTVTPQYQNTAPIITPQFQNTAHILTPLTNIAPNPNPYFQISAPTAFRNIAPHPNPYYQNLPNPHPHLKNGVPTPRSKENASNPQLIQLSPGNQSVTPPVENRAKKRTLVPIATTPITQMDVLRSKGMPKQLSNWAYHDEDFYHVEPLLKQTIEDEIAPMVELFSKRPEYYMKKTDHKIYQPVSTYTTETFRKLLKVSLTKRLLDITTGLVLRIIPVNRWPNYELFREWTKNKGILRLNKCHDMYVAVCGSYKSYDDLAAMKTFTVGDVKMEIKAVHGRSSRKSAKLEACYKQQVPGSRDLLLFAEDAAGAGIDNTDENENTDDEEEDTYNADATEHDDVVIVEPKQEVVVIEDDDDTDTQDEAEGDERTELTEGVDEGSGDQNDFIDNADNDGNNVESLKKIKEETAEHVESLENEQTDEEHLVKRESLETSEDSLQKGKEILEKDEGTLIKSEEPLEMGEDTLEKSEESLETGDDILVKSEEPLETDEDTLEKSEEPLETGEDTLEKSEEPLETGQETLEKSEDPSEIPETEFSLTGDNLEAEIIDGIVDDDLEDF